VLTLRKHDERGSADFGWLQTRYSFSFANYYDPQQMGFRSLRVINEDHVAPKAGFPSHGHRDMEIITYILSGQLAHKDNLGNGSVIDQGKIQRMTAGTGIIHSEFNASADHPVHLLQIWIEPNQRGLPPSYEEKTITCGKNAHQLQVIASPTPSANTITVHQDMTLAVGRLSADETLSIPLDSRRYGWLQVTRGNLVINQLPMQAGDGMAVAVEPVLKIDAQLDCEFLWFDLA
jgi:redox-sensitive bicupin YhaK (pirin superfamily)